jgi:hypothetical protein
MQSDCLAIDRKHTNIRACVEKPPNVGVERQERYWLDFLRETPAFRLIMIGQFLLQFRS